MTLPFLLLGGLAMTALAYTSIQYIGFSGFFDHGEPNLAVRSWRVAQGLTAYMPPDAPDFLLTLYGPFPYVWNGLILKLFGGSLATAKLGGILAMTLSLAAFGLHGWRRFGPLWLPVALALFAAALLMGMPYTLWTRADPVNLMLASLGLFLTAELARNGRPWWAPALALGVTAGLALNVKAHAFLFFAPLAFGFLSKRPLLAWPLAALTAALAWYLPFLHPAFPLDLYLSGLSKAVGVRGIEPDLLFASIKRTLPFHLPLLLLPLAWKRLTIGERRYALAYEACLGAALYPASVAGSGWYQLVPFLPIWADLCLRLAIAAFNGSPRRLAAALLVMVALPLLLGWPVQRRLHKYMDERAWMTEAAQEAADLAASHPGQKIEMGFGRDVAETYRTTFIKPLLAFMGNPVSFDGWSDMEAAFIGLPPSPTRLEGLAACGTSLWLIPADEPPFTMPSVFLNQDFLFAYRLAFLERYELREKGRFFDLWACRGS